MGCATRAGAYDLTLMRMTNPRISLVASALTSDAREAARLSREAGFAGLLFDAHAPMLNLAELSQSGRREFRQLIASEAQTLVGVQMDLGPKGFGPGADLDRLLAQIDKAIHAAIELGAGVICIDLGMLPAPPEPPKTTPAVSPEQAGLIILPTREEVAKTARPMAEAASPPPDPQLVSQVDSAMAALGEIADRYRATIAFHSSLAGFAAIERAVNAARCPWFGIDLDPVAVLRDRWPSDETFSRLGNLIRHVRARDAVLGTDRRTKPVEIGRGSVTWPELLGALDESDYAGWLTIDPADLPDPRRAAEIGLARLRSPLR
jgi:sugar phosphate isomerase/epimerase